MGINRSWSITLFFLANGFICGGSFAHGVVANKPAHQFDDMYLAAQVRAEEAKNGVAKYKHARAFRSNFMLGADNNRAVYGEWGEITVWPFAFASAANLPDGRILAWGGNNLFSFTGGKYTHAAIWEPSTGYITEVDNPYHSMFCGIPVMLEDGRVFVNGGNGGATTVKVGDSVRGTSTFDYKTQVWRRIEDMAAGRWYGGTVALPNGQVFTAAGQPGSDYSEIWTPGQGWDYLNGANIQSAILDFQTVTEPKNWLPHLHLAPNGKIFHSGHTPEMHYIDLGNNGSVSPVAIFNDWNTANTSGVLFDEGKLLQAGGSLYDAENTASNKAAVIDLNADIPSRTPIGSMQFARIFYNQVVLPDGDVMVIGGNTSGKKFSDMGSQYTPELWNPSTQTWRPLADLAIPRNYHSVALLMLDGRVWSGGGGLCDCSADHPDSQVFSPPYLFNADGSLAERPEIFYAPDKVAYGLTVDVQASPDVQKFTMVRMSSTTHALNSDMRFINVPFVANDGGNYTVNFHTNSNVMTPGYWMLFALNGQGVPSVAKVIQVSTSNAPDLSNPGDQNAFVNADVSLNVVATDPNGDSLSFSAAGLPQGLGIDANTGVISGVPVSAGNYHVVISVSDGTHTVSVNFIWNIVIEDTPVMSPVFGRSGGIPFSDIVPNNQFLVGINIRSGLLVNSIQGLLNRGALLKHGGNGEILQRITWPKNEYLVRLYGLHNISIGQISFVTNTGRVLGPYGTAQGLANAVSFDYTIPEGNEIIGFTGRSSNYLNAIGVLYRARQIINQPPAVEMVADQVDTTNSKINLSVIATDPEQALLHYSAEGLPPGLTIGADNGLISGTPSALGRYDLIVKVTDDKGAVSAINFKWDITTPMAINPINTLPQPVNTDVKMVASAVNAKNPRYKWSFGDDTPETDYSVDASARHSYAKPGLFVVRATVTDDTGATDSTTFIQAIHLPHTAQKSAMSSNMAVSSSKGKHLLWLVNQDNDTVSVFDTDGNAKLAEIAVGASPRSVVAATDGQIWVSNKYDASISVINPDTMQVVRTISLPPASQPFGLVFSPDGNAAYVVLEAIGKLLKLDPIAGSVIGDLDIGPNPRHLAISGDGGKLLVSRFITRPLPGESTPIVQTASTDVNWGGEIVVVNTDTMTIGQTVVLQHSDKEDTESQGAGLPNYLAMPVISPDGQTAWIPSKQDNIKRGSLRNGNGLNFQNTVRAIASKLDLTKLSEDYAARIDFDNSGVASAAAFDHSGNFLFVALESTREVSVVDAYGGRELGRIRVGHAPDGLVVAEDGQTLYVNNFMDRSVSVVDLNGLLAGTGATPPVIAELAAVAVEKLSATEWAGKQLFYDAIDPRLARDGYLSCAACHNDGGHDGRVWDLTGFGEGLRNTVDLRGRAGTAQGKLHWSGNFDEVQDFEGQIRHFSGGIGLMDDADFLATQNPLGLPKKGLSADLDALAGYVSSLNTFTPSPVRPASGELSALAMDGKSVFSAAGCSQCHGGGQFTDSPSGLRHDVGTIKPSSGKRLNGLLDGLDTPTLRDIWHTAPYLHDGSAQTIKDAIVAHSGVSLDAAGLDKLEAYLLELGGDELTFPNSAPAITLTAPVNGDYAQPGTAINLAADASDSDGSVVKVEFFANDALLGADTEAPYGFNWANVAQGEYVVSAKAYDNYGAVTASNTALMVVKEGNKGTGLLGQYFNNVELAGIPVLQRIESVNFDWGSGSPNEKINNDNFSVRWKGLLEAPKTESYTFKTVADNGVRLRVNGQLLIDGWSSKAAKTNISPEINLVAGSKYEIVMEFYEKTGPAKAKLFWRRRGYPAAANVFLQIPAERLYLGR